MSSYTYLLIPEALLLVTILLFATSELLLPQKRSRRWLAWVAVGALVLAIGSLLFLWVHWHRVVQGHPVLFWQGAYLFDSFGVSLKLLLLLALLYVFLFSLGQREMIAQSGLYYALLMTAGLGAIIIVSSFEGIAILVGLEIFSIATYFLFTLARRTPEANKPIWKIMLTGGVGTALIAYSFSFLYGVTGSTHLLEIASLLPKMPDDFLFYLYLSPFLFIVGFALKGGSTWLRALAIHNKPSVLIFFTMVGQVALFGALLRLFLWGYQPLWQKPSLIYFMQIMLMLVAIAAIFWGYWQATRQQEANQLLLNLGTAQWGFLLMPIALFQLSQGDFFIRAIFFGLVVYVLVIGGAYTVVSRVIQQAGSEKVNVFAGLAKRAPGLSLAVTLFLLSLAGLPLTAGFISRFLILSSSFTTPEGLVVGGFALLCTLLATVACFRLIRQIYLRPASVDTDVAVPWPHVVLLALSLLGVLGLALLPDLLLQLLAQVRW